ERARRRRVGVREDAADLADARVQREVAGRRLELRQEERVLVAVRRHALALRAARLPRLPGLPGVEVVLPFAEDLLRDEPERTGGLLVAALRRRLVHPVV